MIEERNRLHREALHNKICNKINNERKKYCESLEKYNLIQKENELIKKEKAFRKYQNFVSFIKNYYIF